MSDSKKLTYLDTNTSRALLAGEELGFIEVINSANFESIDSHYLDFITSEILLIQKRNLLDENGKNGSLATKWTQDEIYYFLRHQDAYIYVFRNSTEVLGYLVTTSIDVLKKEITNTNYKMELSHHVKDSIYVYQIAVAPSSQRFSVGSHLMHRMHSEISGLNKICDTMKLPKYNHG